jgi:hypothetical protein
MKGRTQMEDVCENKVDLIRDYLGPRERERVTGWKRKLHKEKLDNLCSSPDIIRAIKSRKIK